MVSRLLRLIAGWLDNMAADLDGEPHAMYLTDIEESATRVRRVERLRMENPQRESF